MIDLSDEIQAKALIPAIDRMWGLSAEKIRAIERRFDRAKGAPVFTVNGRYTSRGWTEWTQGFQYGSAVLQFDATGDEEFLDIGRQGTIAHMTPHVTHTGVHDHGFNNISTYGNLLRLMQEGRLPERDWERLFYGLALKCSGDVQARRWSDTADGGGYVYSFNGPHSLFADTIRSMRSLAVAHRLGHKMKGEQDTSISILERMLKHILTTARYAVYYGEKRDGYDVRGRVAHESIFNAESGMYRCPNSQQGYAPFSTWTRGLAWIMCGFAEQLEFFTTLSEGDLDGIGDRSSIEQTMRKAAMASCDFYIAETPVCGVPYWDTGAPGLHKLGDYLHRPADPFNDVEPVDSSAAAIAAQGLLRLGRYLGGTGDREHGNRYWQAGLKTLTTLLAEPYMSEDAGHQGLLIHTVYHWPNRWDHVPEGRSVACGEAAMWGDYHLREAALLAQRAATGAPDPGFYNVCGAL